MPEWLDEFTDYCIQRVPFYRTRHALRGQLAALSFADMPSLPPRRSCPRVWDFVPDELSLEELIVFSTSGTTGHPTKMLSHPATAACGVPILEHALKRWGLSFPRGAESVAITNVAAYQVRFTTAIVVAWLQEAGCIRVNLHPSAWRKESDREVFINTWQAPIWLADPIALEQMQNA